MEKLLPWLSLRSVPGVGCLLYRRLIDRFQSPAAVFEAPLAELLQVAGINRRQAQNIKNHHTPDRVFKEIDLIGKKRIRIVTMQDPDYPSLLRQIPDPPPYLYGKGSRDALAKHLAVGGSRNATPYGLANARRLSANLAKCGLTIVSGMALGIDTAAHEGALRAGGKTVAVLGSGFERIYPAANRKLFNDIADTGAVITEFALPTEPEAHNFPVRNRIISGMSLGTVVVEATRKSGSLITARLAAEQNREVFAVPGSIQSFKSTGTHTLIKQGAKLVENAPDILEEISNVFPHPLPATSRKKACLPDLTPEELLVMGSLAPYPVHIDDLIRKIDLQPGKISGALLQLELKGIVQQSAGKLFSLVDDG
jgi:DNA processing protein